MKEEEKERERERRGGGGGGELANSRSLKAFVGIEVAAPNWRCIQLTRLTLVCEVTGYCWFTSNNILPTEISPESFVKNILEAVWLAKCQSRTP